MKKNELIKYLNEIDGNPEIIFYNGFVDDWQHIDAPYKTLLVKDVFNDEYRKLINHDRLKNNRECITDDEFNIVLKNINNSQQWQFPNGYSYTDFSFKTLKEKSVIVLEAKPINKTKSDRFGNMSY